MARASLLTRWRLALVLVVSMAASASAQDTHYWSMTYGNRSTLLGGAVIGDAVDLGTTFYNPGMLPLLEETQLELTSRLFEYQWLTVEDGAGRGRDISSSVLRPAPSLIAGSVDFGDEHRFAFSFLTRQRLNLGIKSQGTLTSDVIEDAQGEELFAAGFVEDVDLQEWWVGASYGNQLLPGLGVGITQYLTIRDQDRRQQLIGEALTGEGDVAIAFKLSDYEYRTYGLAWKLGVGYERGPWGLGFAVTTPIVRLGGSGTTIVNQARTGVDTDGDGEEDPVLVGDIQEGSARYKLPWALGAGLKHRWERLCLYLSAEYYGGVGRYDVLDTEPFLSQTTGEELENRIVAELDEVVNYAFGAEYDLREWMQLYASFIADHSAGVESLEVSDHLSTYDIRRITAGLIFRAWGADWMAGLSWGFGSEPVRRLIDLEDPTADLIGGGGEAQVRYNQLKVIFGFSFNL